ncbi:hypothetical protein BOTBODRAFT_188477 [Botryobasidium botryosum FD-172 SS1]|uniref:RNA helicase n=1 Tax=Botryobasidium botryosum (strain FD-172 SS1) TaxID=930990 RepID=A0A067MNM2_BOTB1|nr:hypothetical protein BOTBODRAFT_188477 [Botryobasidium botryosum FD-172 SS1]
MLRIARLVWIESTPSLRPESLFHSSAALAGKKFVARWDGAPKSKSSFKIGGGSASRNTPARFRLSKEVSPRSPKSRSPRPGPAGGDRYPSREGRPSFQPGKSDFGSNSRPREGSYPRDGTPRDFSRFRGPGESRSNPRGREEDVSNISRKRLSTYGRETAAREDASRPRRSADGKPDQRPRDTSFSNTLRSISPPTQTRVVNGRTFTKDNAPHLDPVPRRPRPPAPTPREPAPVSTYFHEHRSSSSLPAATSFASPPLLPGIVASLQDVLGPSPRPTKIQALSIAHFFPTAATTTPKQKGTKGVEQKGEGAEESDAVPHLVQTQGETLIASETGSGKSIAYLLPVLQGLKQTETSSSPTSSKGPRALILAPTHELCRQLSSFTKSLSHVIKLRTLCLSNPNASSSGVKSLRDLGEEHDDTLGQPRMAHAVDVMVGTPSRVAELAGIAVERPGERERKGDVGAGAGTKPSIGLEGIEWLVVDEADVLLDKDFSDSTLAIMKAVRVAKTKSHPSPSEEILDELTEPASPEAIPAPTPEAIPENFNLILCTATVPAALHSYLATAHPDLVRLTTPTLHTLPRALSTERIAWSGGNRLADIHKKIKEIFADDAVRARMSSGGRSAAIKKQTGKQETPSKMIIFCNKTERVGELGGYLEAKGVECVRMTGESDARRKGSNKHLEAFLNVPRTSAPAVSAGPPPPRILITTSLLSRGLDFSPDVKHVLIADEPKNEVDFLHRAGRSGRAGRAGNVIVFGKEQKRAGRRWK